MRLVALLLLGACAKPAPAPPPLDVPPLTTTPSAPSVPEGARAQYLEAAVAERRGDVARAEAAYRWVTRLDSLEPWPWLALGRFLERQRRQDEAIAVYQTAVDRAPELGEAHLALGSATVRAGQLDAGLAPLQRASELGHPQGTHLYIRALMLTGQRAEADAALTDWLSVAIAPSDRLDRARLSYELGRDGDVMDDLLVADWLMAPTPAGDLLVDAARRSCRLGDAWRIVRGNGMVARQNPAWQRTVSQVASLAVDEGLWQQVSAEPFPETKPTCEPPRVIPPGCDGAQAAWQAWQAVPTRLDVWERARALGTECTVWPDGLDPEQITRWLTD